MSMKIANDAQTNKALNAYNTNKTYAEKNFERVANGMKIIGAADNSSAYAISERMRELIRSFSQDEQNVQNGTSIVKTAERAIDQIVQNLRTLKELALDAANDSNTNEDRRVIQKEFDQIVATIDEIALGTNYNGKFLLNGSYLAPEPDKGNTTVDGIIDGFYAGYNATSTSRDYNGAGEGSRWRFEVQQSFAYSYDPDSPVAAPNFSAYVDFSSMDVIGEYPQCLHRQGFAVLCGGCMQFINVIFDATKSASESTVGRPPAPGNNQAKEFVIGVRDVNSAEDLPKAILQGIYVNSSSVPGVSTEDNSMVDYNHELRIRVDPQDSSKIMFQKNGPDLQFRNRPIKLGTEGNPLWVQHGTRSGQRIHLYINPMDASTLGINTLSVRTRDEALSTISAITTAIGYSLNEATTMGAYLQRLETTNLSIATMNENIQAAESTIRDADMAKEMTEYVRYNILNQSSQAMLAQSQQQEENVLGFIR